MSIFKLSVFAVFLVADIEHLFADPGKGFTYIGRSPTSLYFLSNTNDKRRISAARIGCEDSFRDGQLVALETNEEHQEVRRLLSVYGITENDRVWTSGDHDGSEWVWYDYYSGNLTSIENACEKPEWVNNVCPTDGCLTIGGQGSTYKWQSDNCKAKRHYLCEYPDETLKI